MSPRKRRNEKPKTLVAERLCDFFEGKNFVEISKETLFSDVQISAYLQGETAPSAKLLEYIARNGGDVNYILTGERKPQTAHSELTAAQKLALSHLQTLFGSLLEAYHNAIVDPEGAEDFVNLVEQLSSTATGKAS